MAFKFRGHLVVLGCFLIQLSLGALYSDEQLHYEDENFKPLPGKYTVKLRFWATPGNFVPYVVSYMRGNGESISLTYVVWIQSVQMASQAILMVPAGFLEGRYGCRFVALAGCFLMSAGTAVSYWTCSTSVVGFTLTFGFMYGIGTGIAYIAAIMGGMKWFPERRGLVNGIVVAGFGLGASIIDPIQTTYINPENYSPDSEGYFDQIDLLSKIPSCFLLMAGIYAGLQLIGCVLMTPAPKAKLTVQTKTVQSEASKMSEMSIKCAPEGFSPKQVLHYKEFYIMWGTLFLNGMIVTFYTSMYKVFGQTFIKDDHFFALIGTFTSVANAVSRLSWGYVVDKISYKTTMTLISGLVAFFLFTMPLTEYGGKAMYSVWTLCMYLSMAGTFAICPTAFSRTFGHKHMTANYSMVLTNNLICPIITASITRPLIDNLGYTGMFLVLGGVMCGTLTITHFYNENHFSQEVLRFNQTQPKRDVFRTISSLNLENMEKDFTESEEKTRF